MRLVDSIFAAKTPAQFGEVISQAEEFQFGVVRVRKDVYSALKACEQRLGLTDVVPPPQVLITDFTREIKENVATLLCDNGTVASVSPLQDAPPSAPPVRPLHGTHLPKEEFAFRAAGDAASGDLAPWGMYADWVEERGGNGSHLRLEGLLRTNTNPNNTENLLREYSNAKSAHVVATLNASFDVALWPHDWEREEAHEGQLKLKAIGLSLPNAAIADFARRTPTEQVGILASLLRLPQQYVGMYSLHRRGNLLAMVPDPHAQEKSQQAEGFIDHHGQLHPFPSYDDIHLHLRNSPQEHRSMLFQRALQGFDQLIITPRMHVPLLRDSLAKVLQENAARIPGGLNASHPVWMWEQYENADALVYHPKQFDTQHGGQPLTGGYDITLVEDMRVLPEANKEPVTAGYRSLGRNLRPTDYLDLLHGRSNYQVTSRKLDHPAHYQGLIGWTPQQYCVADMVSVDLSGFSLDQDGAFYSVSYLPGAYFPASRRVPCGYWFPGLRQAYLDWRDPGDRGAVYGARVAVRVA